MSKRIDVSSRAPALTQNPFARLAGAAALEGKSDGQTEVKAEARPEAPAAGKTAVKGPAKAARGRLILRRETKHRGGKTVVLISGFAALGDHDMRRLGELEKQLKQRLGCGGSLEEEKREILIQGDRPDEIAEILRSLGYDVGGVTTSPRR
jgi:translation initiation factor 1